MDEEKYTEEERIKDLDEAIKRGNNKSASSCEENKEAVNSNYDKEVAHGWMIPIKIDVIKKIKGTGVIPIGIATQFTIDEKGKRKIKRRLTHNCSRVGPTNTSVNSRCDKELLEPSIFAFCFLRILHMLHAMRLKYPMIAILLNKADIDAAYRRIHVILAHALL